MTTTLARTKMVAALGLLGLSTVACVEQATDDEAWDLAQDDELVLRSGPDEVASAVSPVLTTLPLRIDVFYLAGPEPGHTHARSIHRRRWQPTPGWGPEQTFPTNDGGAQFDLLGAPSCASRGSGLVDCFVRRAIDDSVWGMSLAPSDLATWHPIALPTDTRSSPAAVSVAPDTVDVFYVGASQDLAHLRWDGGWVHLETIAAPLPGFEGDPSCTTPGDGSWHCVVRLGEYQVWHGFGHDELEGSEHGTTHNGAPVESSPTIAGRMADGSVVLEAFYRYRACATCEPEIHQTRSTDGGPWGLVGALSATGQTLVEMPQCVQPSPNLLSCFGPDDDGAFKGAHASDGEPWSTWVTP